MINIEYFDLAFLQMHLIWLEALNERVFIDSCKSCMILHPLLDLNRYIMLDQTDPQPFTVVKDPSVPLMKVCNLKDFIQADKESDLGRVAEDILTQRERK